MIQLTVLNKEAETTKGWAARACEKGLTVNSRAELLDNEAHIIKDTTGNFVKLTQSATRSRMLNVDRLTVEQKEIVKILQECGLIQSDRRSTRRLIDSDPTISREGLANQARGRSSLKLQISKTNLLSSVSAQMSIMESQEKFTDIAALNTEFSIALGAFESGTKDLYDVQRAATRFAAIILATAQRCMSPAPQLCVSRH